MAILFSDSTYRTETIFTALKKAWPEADWRCIPDIGNKDDIDYAVVWYPPAGSLHNLPNLKAIFSVAAGVDGLLRNPEALPPNIPIVRSVDDGLTTGMVEYVLYQVLKLHRGFHLYEAQQRDSQWKQWRQARPEERSIGIMGLGEMGGACAKALVGLGFQVRGWSRTGKNLPGVAGFAGREQLPDFLSGLDVLVNVLPLTSETRGLLNKDLFALLPQGAFLINAGRGGHLVGADLLAALETGQLAHAILDVFETEPLPPDSPFWTHPQVTVTPHIASITDFAAVAGNIRRHIAGLEAGQPLPHTVDLTRGY